MNNAERIYNELRHEVAAIWYISDEYGSKVMVKAPTTSIKALTKGCKIEFLFGRDENYKPNIFHTGLKIYDDPLNCQMIFCFSFISHSSLFSNKVSIASLFALPRRCLRILQILIVTYSPRKM